MADWQCFARDLDLAEDGELPIRSLALVTKHLDVSTGVLTTPFTVDAWTRTGPGRGVIAKRNELVVFTGPVVSQELSWDKKSGQAVLKLQVVGDEVRLARRLVFPDPTRAGDAQSTKDYWTSTGVASTSMLQLISEQAGPMALPANRIPRLYLGADPGVGAAQPWQWRYDPLLDALGVMSVRSGANLGVGLASTPDGLRADVYAPRDVAAAVTFSAELGNLTGVTYRRAAPEVTTAISAGGGDLKLRLQQQVVSTDPDDAAWRLPGWAYVDRRDTTDTAELVKSATDAVTDGTGTVSIALDLLDTDAVRFGVDWGPWPGDRVTVAVGLPDGAVIDTVADLVRQIRFDVDDDGSETIRPAVGTADASVGPPSLTRTQLASIGERVTLLERRK